MSLFPTPFERPLEPFESPKELIDGAKERLSELEALVQTLSETRDYEIVTQTDPKTGQKIVKLRLKTHFPAKVGRLASSILKELRTALDQAFCDGAICLRRPHAKDIHFPFGKSAEDLNGSVARHCKNVDQRLIDFCLQFKPHYGDDGNSFLWTLSKLAGTTHQSIVGVGWQDTVSFMRAVTVERGPLQLIVNKWNSRHDELEVARLGADAKIHVQPNFALRLNVIFSQRCYAVSGRPLTATLNDLIRMVESIVLGIEAETMRLVTAGKG